ncbi:MULTISPECIES: hypothetical protein [Actinomadura]|uniref:Uncharacterized protein n=1 Tax=Actinomadura madurae TaxID=1993 RepID=A0A1I5GJW2_9ACTN|nr:hypothetical protein [Actinomadura madurae]SFO36285.1 hypothetical protein SAMN04489713_105245 [Actinomadura madurae]SPT51359.1 Uncharacterised protein [Actinomadura madurae]
MESLLARIAAHRRHGARITFRETRGEVCTPACRSAAHVDRTTTAAYRARP